MAVRLMFVRVARGVYRLAGTPAPVELRLSGWRSTAAASVNGEEYVLRMRGTFDRGPHVHRARSDDFVLSVRRRELTADRVYPALWRVRLRLRGYEAHLDVPEMGSVSIRMGFGGRSPVEVDVDGDWPQRDLVVVAAAFAVIMRRREHSGASAAVVATTTVS